MQSSCGLLYCHLLPLWPCHIFPHCLINGKIFGKMLLNIKCVFLFSLQLLSEIFLILIRIREDTVINVRSLPVKYPLFLPDFNKTWDILEICSRNAQISNFIKIRPVGAKMFHGHGQTDGRPRWSYHRLSPEKKTSTVNVLRKGEIPHEG